MVNSSYKKINKSFGKRRKSSESETKERDLLDSKDYSEISSSKYNLKKFAKLKSVKSLNSSKIPTDFNIPSKKAKLETNSVFDQPRTSKSQKEEDSYIELNHQIENRKLKILKIIKI